MNNRDPVSAPQLVGRAAEREEIERLLGSVRSGLSGALVLRGEPGIGKTALLEHAAGLAAEMRVLRLVGIESEMELGYAALHQLLIPLLGHIDVLPVRQRSALGAAFGLEGEATVDRMMVGLATLTLLSASAKPQPLLCVIDDAQWIDRESADILAFVARRLLADRVGMVIAVRDPSAGPATFDGIAETRVHGLAEAEARQLLAGVAAGPVDDRVGRQVVAETRGNPLALVELGPLLTAAQLAGDTDVPEPLPVGRRLETRFSDQVRSLPGDTRTLLLAAAADPTGDPALLWRVSDALGFARDAASAAERADLLVLGPPVAFRHPLIRSAVYYGAPRAERRRVHEALAEATDVERDADRRAWHRAAAADGPDEEAALVMAPST
jgi:AAA ATPase domain